MNKPTLEEGYIICKECNGDGYIKSDNILCDICERCQGEGVLDWIENVVGKKKKSSEEIQNIFTNQTRNEIYIEDLGLEIKPGEHVNLSAYYSTKDINNSVSLKDAIFDGKVIIEEGYDLYGQHRQKPKLKEGDVYCEKCNGIGIINQNPAWECERCQGEGKLDWIENVVGKKKKGLANLSSSVMIPNVQSYFYSPPPRYIETKKDIKCKKTNWIKSFFHRVMCIVKNVMVQALSIKTKHGDVKDVKEKVN